MSEIIKILSLELTEIGQRTMTGLLNKGIKPSLKIALSQFQDIFTGTEPDLATKFTFLSDSMVTLHEDDDKVTKMHIQASFLSDSDFDIYQVGLFIDKQEEANSELTFLAYYLDKNLLAKKLANTQLFLDILVCLRGYKASDFTIEASDYKPLFSIPPATYERYGSVRLATAENIKQNTPSDFVISTATLADREKIDNREPGFIVTTNHLDIFFPDLKSLKLEHIYNGAVECEADAILFSTSCFDNVFINNLITLEKDGKHELHLLRYHSENKKIESYSILDEIKNTNANVKLPDKFNYEPFCASNEGINIECYFFTDATKAEIFLKKLTISLGSSTPFSLASGTSTLKTSVDQLFLYDELICSIEHSANKDSDISFFNKVLTWTKNRKLRYAREKPFVHVIGGEIYCIGGVTNKPLIEIHRAYYYNASLLHDFSSYVPPLSAHAVDLSATDSMLSCRLGNYIYFFNIDTQDGLSRLNASYHQYDILMNDWASLQFSGASLAILQIAFNKASMVTRGKQVYLFLVRVMGKQLKLDIISMTEFLSSK